MGTVHGAIRGFARLKASTRGLDDIVKLQLEPEHILHSSTF
jgi:hypothetical protein